MDFDPCLAEYLHGLRFSTWYIGSGCIEVTAPSPYVLQGLQVHPSPSARAPRGVVRLCATGPYASRCITVVRADAAQSLAAEQLRLQQHLGDGWRLSYLDSQMPVASAAMRGGLQPLETSWEGARSAQIVPLSSWHRRAG